LVRSGFNWFFLFYGIFINKNIMKKIIRLTENDLTRIVKRVMMEQGSLGAFSGSTVGGGSTKVDVGTTLSNGMEVIKLMASKTNPDMVFVQTETSGGGQNFSCKSHESGKFTLRPKGTITKEESQALYDKFCK
jgi:hypothetical protein